VERGGRGRDREDPGEPRVPQRPHGPGRVVSRSGRADRVRRLVEFRHGAADAPERRRVPDRPGASPRRGRARRAIAAGERDDGGEHGGGGAAARPHPSGSAELSERSRAAEITAPMLTFEATMAEWAGLDEDPLSRPGTWRGGKTDVRYALYRVLERAQEAVIAAPVQEYPEARRILAFAQRAFGDLRGLLIGLPDELLDEAPRPG